MTLEEAIKTAIEFETKVRRVYVHAVEQATDPIGKKVFKVLAGEEMNHIAYLKNRYNEWKKEGRITAEKLETAISPKKVIEVEVNKLDRNLSYKDHGEELEMLRKALALEIETSDFYKKMVSTLKAEGRKMFRRFVEIEEGHIAIVQAEIDKLAGLGFWFDIPVFDLETG